MNSNWIEWEARTDGTQSLPRLFLLRQLSEGLRTPYVHVHHHGLERGRLRTLIGTTLQKSITRARILDLDLSTSKVIRSEPKFIGEARKVEQE